MTAQIQDILHRHRTWYCLECGKCSSVCPITCRETREYSSPRLLVENSAAGELNEIYHTPLLWSCLTCKRCSELCPADVHFIEFVRDIRRFARSQSQKGECSHGDVINTWARIMTDPDLSQNRLAWVQNDLKISDNSQTLLFVGCLPYYDTLFQHLQFEGVRIARAAVRILNQLDIVPQLLANERCCGHDQLFQGDFDTFSQLAHLNIQQFKAAGVKQIITTCAECARTLKIDYPALVESHSIAVLHITELLSRHFKEEALSLETGNQTVTFQDPCRLGRHLGVYDDPRTVISYIGANQVEMAATREKSLCCGTSCWTACGQVSKQIQVDRLKQAKATGADILVTACPKCQIHLKCAQKDPDLAKELDIPISDITLLVSEKMGHRK